MKWTEDFQSKSVKIQLELKQYDKNNNPAAGVTHSISDQCPLIPSLIYFFNLIGSKIGSKWSLSYPNKILRSVGEANLEVPQVLRLG